MWGHLRQIGRMGIQPDLNVVDAARGVSFSVHSGNLLMGMAWMFVRAKKSREGVHKDGWLVAMTGEHRRV